MDKPGIFLLLFMAAGMVAAAMTPQESLMKAEAEQLLEINRQVIQQLGDLSKYENNTIYIKAKLIPQGDSKYKVKIERVSTEKIEFGNCSKDEKIIVVKGRVAQDKARKFTIALENVLPPPDDSPKEKNSKDNYKSGDKTK